MPASSLDSLDLFTVTAPGLETLTARELQTLGADARVAGAGGVAWKGTRHSLYEANLRLRTASRIIVRVARFHASSFHELERRARRVPWERFVRDHEGARFRVTCHKSALYHSDAVAQRLADSVTRATGAIAVAAPRADDDDAEPAEGADRAEQLFVVRVDHDTVTVSADSSGALLHRRGYRLATAKAPLRETIAAAMLMGSGWRPEQPLVDPMCGSGTIAIEAALIARRMAPGRARGFRCEAWPDADARAWESVRERARSEELASAPATIVASDRDAGAVEATRANAARAGVQGDITVEQRPLSAIELEAAAHGWIVTNPPYGIRVGTDVRNLYSKLGAIVRATPSWRLAMLSAAPALDRQLRLSLERVFDTRNGGIPVRLVRSREGGETGGE
jgi:putative N6-adenine-specific DNA methylase